MRCSKYIKPRNFMEFRAMIIWISMMISTALLLSGCTDAKYNLLFFRIDGLKKGAPLLFDQNTIGTVKKIIYTEQGEYLVSVSVEQAFVSAMTEYSRFRVVSSPLDNMEVEHGGKAIVMTLEQKDGVPLEKGCTIKALKPSRFSALKQMTPMLEKIENSFEKIEPSLKKLETGFENFLNDLKNIPENETFKTFEKKFEDKINELGTQMKNSGKEVQDNIRNNIIPKLQKELEYLCRKFQRNGENAENGNAESGGPDKIKSLEKKLKNLQEI